MRTTEINRIKPVYRGIAVIFIFVASFVLYSCEDLLNNPDDQHDEYFVEEELAIIVAENLLFTEPFSGDTTTVFLTLKDFSIAKKVEEIRSIKDSNGKVALYIVNYQDGGFVVLSADKRMEPVLAHSEINSFPMDAEFFNLGLLLWIDDFLAHIENKRQSQQEPMKIIQEYWTAVVMAPIDVEFIALACANGYIVRKNLLRTLWDQGCGYNDNVPLNCNEPLRCNKAPVGCVATAMGQILKYHADNGWHGNYYDEDGVLNLLVGWHNMPLTNAASNPGSHLPAVLKDIGLIVKMNYGCTGSGARINNTFNGFRNNFKFNNAKRKNLNSNADYTLLINEIRNNRPVYLQGCDNRERFGLFNIGIKYTDCHAWVAHGFSQLHNCESGYVAGNYKIHMNWGWGGFADGSFLKKEGDFQFIRKMIYNVGIQDYAW